MLKVTKRYILAIAAAAGLGMATSSAMAADPSVSDLQQQIKTLQTQVQDLRDRPAAQTYSQQDVDNVVSHVLSDANRRSMLLDPSTGFSAGYTSKGFVIQSEDGAFMLHPWLQMQVRDVTNYREKAKANGSTITENGIELRRMKFGVDGNLFGKDLTFLVNWATNRGSSKGNVTDPTGGTLGTVGLGNGGVPVLEEAWAQYNFHNTPFGVKVGQIKDSVLHEQIVSSKNQVAAERSLQSDIFLGGDAFIQAIQGSYSTENMHAYLAFTDGLRSNNTNFEDFPQNGSPANYGASGRFEYKFFGDWSDYSQMASHGMKHRDLLVAAIGGDYTEAGHNSTIIGAADVQYNTGPLAVYAAYLGRYNRSGVVFGGHSSYDSSILGQVSYTLGNWEPFARYEYIHFDVRDIAAGSKRNVHDITAGVNYYWHDHKAKFTFDVVYLPNGSPVADDGAGILANSHNEIIARLQFQLLI